MLKIPQVIIDEHEELHEELISATEKGGETEKIAEEVARLLHFHFEKEERYALPPLAGFALEDYGTAFRDEIISTSEKLAAEFPEMLAEHKSITERLLDLKQTARRENHPEVIRFAKKLIHHAQFEEQILYPAAILIGKYLKEKTD